MGSARSPHRVTTRTSSLLAPISSSPGPRAVSPWCAAATCAVALGALVIQHWAVPLNAGSQMGLFGNGGDLDVYRHGGLQVLHRESLYDAELPSGGWFTYPPFAAAVFVPLAALTFTAAKTVWMLLSFAALTATIWRCATVLGYRPDWRLGSVSVAAAVSALDIEPIRGTLWQGQVNLVLMAIVVWDLTRPHGTRLRGWTVGIATGVKLTAVVFVPYLLITRQWRAAITSAVTAAITVVLTWCLLPGDSAKYWFHAVFETDRIGELTHPGNHSIGGILATLWSPAPMPTLLWLFGVGVAAAAGFYAAYRAQLHGNRLLAITLTGLLSCVLPPLAWGHHWVWVVPLLVITIDRAVRSGGRTRWAWIAAAAAIYAAVFMWFYAWLYRTSLSLAPHYSAYYEAWDAAIAHMTRLHKLVTVSTQPLLFALATVVTIAATRHDRAQPRQQANRPALGAHQRTPDKTQGAASWSRASTTRPETAPPAE